MKIITKYYLFLSGERYLDRKGVEPLHGYYAKNQPDYNWSVTEDIEKAYEWNSLKSLKHSFHYQTALQFKETLTIEIFKIIYETKGIIKLKAAEEMEI